MSEPVSYQVNASAGGPQNVIRLIDGVPAKSEITEAEREAYTTPPSDKYHLKIVGFYEPWQQARNPQWITADSPATHETKTRLEFEIASGKGKGRRFTSIVTVSINDRSNLGQVWKAAVGAITPKVELTDMLGKELVIYVDKVDKVDENGNKKSYANPTWKTARAVGDESGADDDGWEAA